VLVGSNQKPMSVGDFIFMRSDQGQDEKEICQVTFFVFYLSNGHSRAIRQTSSLLAQI
jgi:hypothetical protein